jgi:putative membrane protein
MIKIIYKKTVFIIALFFLTLQIHAQPNQDGEIMAFLIVVNNHEIATAQKVINKALKKEVISFAHLMIRDHSNNLRDTQNIKNKYKIPELQNAKIQNLKGKSKKEQQKISSLKGSTLEKSYIKAMVAGHSDVLREIDKYMRTVKNQYLRKHLLKTRPHVAHHLELAKKLQRQK